MSKINIILGYRNRDIERVERCLDSFTAQTFQDFEVIFVDYGSDEDYSIKIKSLLKKYDFVKYIYNNTIGMPWNRSHALNTGIKKSNGEYLFFGDIDIIYPDNMLEELFKNIDDNVHIYNRMILLPENFNDWQSIKNKTINYIDAGQDAKGPAHFIKREYIEKISGFDEYYCFWGVEDRDLYTRLEKIGLKEKWLDKNNAPMFHQWHPMVSDTKKGLFPEKWWDDMNIYYEMNADSVVRNNEEWGKLYTENNRVILRKDLIKKEVKIPSEGNSYIKASFIVKIINLLNNLEKNECLKLIIEKKPKTYPSEQFKYKEFINKIAKKLFKIENDLFDFIKEERNQIFSPEEDTMYLVWVLIKRYNIVKDYFIQYNDDNIIIELAKKNV